jgi:hypothetical protein
MLSIAVLQVSACGGKSQPTNSPAPSTGAAAAGSTLPSALSAAGPIIGAITSAVPGLSQIQAALGAGSLLGLAKAKMPAGQFSQVAGAIPGANALVSEAVKKGAPSAPSGLSSMTDFLSKSGISAGQVSQLAGVLTNAVSGKVPADVASAFASALM